MREGAKTVPRRATAHSTANRTNTVRAYLVSQQAAYNRKDSSFYYLLFDADDYTVRDYYIFGAALYCAVAPPFFNSLT